MCGVDNSYKHPHKKIVERLAEYCDNIYRTDIDGTIVFTSDQNDIEVKTENQEK